MWSEPSQWFRKADSAWPVFHKTLKTSLHRPTGLRKDSLGFMKQSPVGFLVALATLNWAILLKMSRAYRV